jgi:tetratricopeptide (TPR) repeat protein
MAKGMFGGMLGGEDEEKAASTKAGPEAFVAAVAANTANQSPEVAAETVALFRKQAELLEAQRKSVEAEHEFFEVEWGPRLLGIRLRVGFQVFVALFAILIGIGAAIAIYDAVHSRSVIVDPFDAPASLAERGLTGRVVAAGMLDRLIQLQVATRIAAQKREISSAWTNEIAIDVPETGLSIGQIERILKTRFGHDQHINGDLVKTDSMGLALTVRGVGVLPKTFSDQKGDLDALLSQAAEYVYGESQPRLFVHYLANDVGRYNDAIAFAKSHLAKASVEDQPFLLNYWANSLSAMGDTKHQADALRLYQEAVRIKPDYWNGYNNIILELQVLGEEEKAFPVNEQMMKLAGGRPGKAPELDYHYFDPEAYNLQTARSSLLADIAATGGITGAATSADILIIAQIDVQLHEVDTARLRLTTAVWDPKSHLDVAQDYYVQALLAEEIGDLSRAAKYWDDFAGVYADPVVAVGSPSYMCWAAPTYQKTAQPAKADAALDAPMKTVGVSTYIDCYRFRGDVLDLRGNWAGAQEWYAKAVKLAPSIPSGYCSWGVALAKHGDLNGAAAKFQSANQKGPHWADPLKAWGDVLVKQGQTKDALTKYDEALKYAPNWKELKEARDAAAKQKS